MGQTLLELVLDEGKWLFYSMLVAALVAALWLRPPMADSVFSRLAIIRGMNLFYGSMIGTMAFGHLLAVTIRMAQGTLGGSWWLLYPLGLVLFVPAWWLVAHAKGFVLEDHRSGKALLALNGWLFAALVAIGFHNLPLGAPAVLNMAYLLQTRRAVGWTIVSVAIAAHVALLAGSLVFLASGQSFEQFSGME